MSKLLVSLLAIFSLGANAATGSFSLTCDGKQMAPGDTGPQGSVLISGVQSGNSWNVSVLWQNSVLLSGRTICGSAAPANASCTMVSEGAPDFVTHFFVKCVDPNGGFDTTGLPHLLAQAVLSLNSEMDHGVFMCDQNDKIQIQLSNCH